MYRAVEVAGRYLWRVYSPSIGKLEMIFFFFSVSFYFEGEVIVVVMVIMERTDWPSESRVRVSKGSDFRGIK